MDFCIVGTSLRCGHYLPPHMKFYKVRTRRTWTITAVGIIDLTDLADACDAALAATPRLVKADLVTDQDGDKYFRRLSWERLAKQLRRAAKMRGAHRIQVWT